MARPGHVNVFQKQTEAQSWGLAPLQAWRGVGVHSRCLLVPSTWPTGSRAEDGQPQPAAQKAPESMENPVPPARRASVAGCLSMCHGPQDGGGHGITVSSSPGHFRDRADGEEEGQPAGVLAGARGCVSMAWSEASAKGNPVKGTETRPGHRWTPKDLGIHPRCSGLAEGQRPQRDKYFCNARLSSPYFTLCAPKGVTQWG